MAKDSVSAWLAAKRQQGSQVAAGLGVAPGAATRYGWDPVANGPALPLQSGKYTGAGPDGKVQPTMPTERRMAVNGRPYAVDEGEVVVTDAATVQAYGGPEGLDRFIQSHRPRQPQQQQDPQVQEAAELRQAGIRQMFTGGVPTHSPFPHHSNPTIRPGPGPEPTTAPAGHQPFPHHSNPTIRPGPGPEPATDSAPPMPTLSPPNFTSPLSSFSSRPAPPAPPGSPVPLLPEMHGTATPPEPVNRVAEFVLPGPEPTAAGAPPLPEMHGTAGTQDMPELYGHGDRQSPTVFDPTKQDQAAMNYYTSRLTAQQQAERAAEAQSAMQQGAGAETVRGLQAVGDVSRRSQVGDTVAQMGTAAADRGEDRQRWQSEFGLRSAADQRAAEMHGAALRGAAEQDAAGYFANMGLVEGYDWRTDDLGRGKMQAVWEANGNSGVFDESWADSFYKSSTITVGQAFITQARQDPSYINAPDETTYNDDGTIAVWGKDRLDEGFETMAQAITLGNLRMHFNPETGRVQLVDPGGTPVGGPGDPPPTPTWIEGSQDNNAAYATDWGKDSGAFGVTANGFQQWMASNNNQPPPDADAWESWSWKDRTYDIHNEDDLDAAMVIVEQNERIMGSNLDVTRDMVSLYLATHEGKFDGNTTGFINWVENQGDVFTIRDFMRGDYLDPLNNRDAAYLEKAISAIDLVSRRGEMDDEEWSKALEDAGFVSDDEVQWFSKNVLVGTDSVDNTHASHFQEPVLAGTTPPEGTRTYERTPLAFQSDWSRGNSWASVARPLDPEVVAWATENAGQPVNVNGRQYILGDATDLQRWGTQPGGGSRGSMGAYQDGHTFVQGFRAYDVAERKWVVLSPQSLYVTVGDPTGHIDARTEEIKVTDEWATYDLPEIDEFPSQWNYWE